METTRSSLFITTLVLICSCWIPYIQFLYSLNFPQSFCAIFESTNIDHGRLRRHFQIQHRRGSGFALDTRGPNQADQTLCRLDMLSRLSFEEACQGHRVAKLFALQHWHPVALLAGEDDIALLKKHL